MIRRAPAVEMWLRTTTSFIWAHTLWSRPKASNLTTHRAARGATEKLFKVIGFPRKASRCFFGGDGCLFLPTPMPSHVLRRYLRWLASQVSDLRAFLNRLANSVARPGSSSSSKRFADPLGHAQLTVLELDISRAPKRFSHFARSRWHKSRSEAPKSVGTKLNSTL